MTSTSPGSLDGTSVQADTRVSSAGLRSVPAALALLMLASCVRTPQAPWCMGGVANTQPRQAFYDARYGYWMYQIQPGDTRSELEKRFGLTPRQLELLNPAIPLNRDFIHADYYLRVR